MPAFYCHVRRWKYLGVCIVLSLCILITVYSVFNKREKIVDDYVVWSSDSTNGYLTTNQQEPQLKHPLCEGIWYVSYPEFSASATINSTCSLKATLRGKGQKVVSFSFYGEVSNNYFEGIEIQAKKVSQLYPGWVMRIYHNVHPLDYEGVQRICDIVKKYPHVDDCFVRDLPTMGNIEKTFGSIWRFAALGDPLVDVFVVRDLDSLMLQREVDAVDDWLKNTNNIWHFMRDYNLHNTPILAGMWGARNLDLHLMVDIRNQIFSNSQPHVKTLDQELLDLHVWLKSEGNRTVHDSFFCMVFPQGWRPFPSQRQNFTFVGGFEGMQSFSECPWQCRPEEHKDWTYC